MKKNTYSEVVNTLVEMNGVSNNVPVGEIQHIHNGRIVVIFNNINGGTAFLIPVDLSAEEKIKCAEQAIIDLEACKGKKGAKHFLTHREELVALYYQFMRATFDNGPDPLVVSLPKLAKELVALVGPVNCIFDLRDQFENALILSHEECVTYLSNVHIRILEEEKSDADSDHSYDVRSSREQLVTLLLPPVSPKGTILQIRVETSDKRISLDTALNELIEKTDYVGEYDPNCHRAIPVRERIWQQCRTILSRYIADEYLQKDAELLLETALLVNVHHLCATYPVESNFIVDLKDESTGRVAFEFSAQIGSVEFDANAVWNHIDHYDMSGDFRWSGPTVL
jgi:hypothetical protein